MLPVDWYCDFAFISVVSLWASLCWSSLVVFIGQRQSCLSWNALNSGNVKFEMLWLLICEQTFGSSFPLFRYYEMWVHTWVDIGKSR